MATTQPPGRASSWRDALVSSAQIVAVTLVLGLVAAWLMLPSNSYLAEHSDPLVELTTMDRIRIGLDLACQIFGVDTRIQAANPSADVMALDAGVGMIPTTLLLVVLAVAVRAFRVRSASYDSVWAGLGLAARIGLITGVLLGLVSRLATQSLDASAWGGEVTGVWDAVRGATVGPAAYSAFVQPAMTLLVVLGVSCLLRRDWLGGDLALWLHDHVGVGLRVLVRLVWLLPILGVIAVLAIGLTSGDSTDGDFEETKAALTALVAWSGNLGVWALTLGMGGRLGVNQSVPPDLEFYADDVSARWAHLPDVANDWFNHAWGLWVVAGLAPAIVVWMVLAVRRRSTPVAVTTNLFVLAGLMLVAVPGLVRGANLHAGGTAKVVFYGDWTITVDAGSGAWILTGTVVGLIAICAGISAVRSRPVAPSNPESPPESGGALPTG